MGRGRGQPGTAPRQASGAWRGDNSGHDEYKVAQLGHCVDDRPGEADGGRPRRRARPSRATTPGCRGCATPGTSMAVLGAAGMPPR